MLREICGTDQLHFQLTRELLDVERQYRTMARRAGLFKALEGALRRGFYESVEDAEQRALARRDMLEGARAKAVEPELPLFEPVEHAEAPPLSRGSQP